MSDLPFQKQAELWGKTYEILVKRGVLASLVECEVLPRDHESTKVWRETKLLKISSALIRELDILDEREREIAKAGIDHMALGAFGLGYTTTRQYLLSHEKALKRKKLMLRGIWCPLTLPGDDTSTAEARLANATAFRHAFRLPENVVSGLSGKGEPSNADFLLWLSGSANEDHILVQEYSYDMPGELGDFRMQEAHLDELLRHRRIVNSRSVFANVAAEVAGEDFNLSSDIRHHLTALSGDNKPLFKLCQACSYAETFAQIVLGTSENKKPIVARALAITPNGLESLAAQFGHSERCDPRVPLMQQLGAAYRGTQKLADGDEEGLTKQVEAVFNSIRRKLPIALQQGMRQLTHQPEPGNDYVFEFEESIPNFANPMMRLKLDEAASLVEDTKPVIDYFDASGRGAVMSAVKDLIGDATNISLRDLHAAATVAGIRRSTKGMMNVIALEGNPGIGKTTAVRRYLSETDNGYLFIYVSPRVILNRDVTESLARNNGRPTGILALTSNAQLNAAAKRYHESLVEKGLAKPRHIDGGVIADGVGDLNVPSSGSILIITPEQETEIDSDHAGSTVAKTTLSELEDRVKDAHRIGVLQGLAKTTRELMQINPSLNRIVLTAALQGFRERGAGQSTISALSNLFENKAESNAGRRERQRLAERTPNIIVMIDELAGDGAGSPFVHAVARWLESEFLECFEDEPSPFAITLIASDASLGNEIVLSRYLDAGERTPDKILVSRSSGESCFRIAVTDVRIGGVNRPTLHVMANSFPASSLHIRYQTKLTAVRIQELDNGMQETPRQAIRRVAEDSTLDLAVVEIQKAFGGGAAQVIYFAQDKCFLSDLRSRLVDFEDIGLNKDNVQILDSSIPGWRRKQLIEPKLRDSIKVFLMTSSGARGVSFPRTDWIIANVPRFNVESSLMEIAQLIYRGRGKYIDENGDEVSGDHAARHLVMLVEDFMVSDQALDKRQWLRQSIDLMTLLVMLRATIWTRITGASGLRQPVALVPVGAVGVEELVSLMSTNVTRFIEEAEVFSRRSSDANLKRLVKAAQANVVELFSRPKLHANAHAESDSRTYVKPSDLGALHSLVVNAVGPLLVSAESKSLPDHVYFAGPVIVENWSNFTKQEAFSFEGHKTQDHPLSSSLLSQLSAIDEERTFPASLRNPAINLYKLLIREKHKAAHEYSTIKDLKSPNTWVGVPIGYTQFLNTDDTTEGRPFYLDNPELWLDALSGSLSATSAIIPPLPRFQTFPWAASVGKANPLRLDQVFDDRYFMASNEMNLLNTLLLAASED